MTPTIPDIIAAIRERDSGTTFYEGRPERWDSILAAEVERLQAVLRKVQYMVGEQEFAFIEEHMEP